jgi:hypothetical protein
MACLISSGRPQRVVGPAFKVRSPGIFQCAVRLEPQRAFKPPASCKGRLASVRGPSALLGARTAADSANNGDDLALGHVKAGDLEHKVFRVSKVQLRTLLGFAEVAAGSAACTL